MRQASGYPGAEGLSARARVLRRAGAALMLAGLLALGGAPVAAAGPLFHIHALTDTTVAPGGTLQYMVLVSNAGDEATPGNEEEGQTEPQLLQVQLPAGVRATSAQSVGPAAWDCSETEFASEPSSVVCKDANVSDPRRSATRSSEVHIFTNVASGASGVLTASFDMTGGGAPPVSTVAVTRVSPALPDFGVSGFDSEVTADAAGDAFTQAGGHPYAIRTAIMFNTYQNPLPVKGDQWPVQPAKDALVDLPPGLVGYPTATAGARCTATQLSNSQGLIEQPLCPAASQVGAATVFIAVGETDTIVGDPLPVYNMVAPPGVPARFGFNLGGTVVSLDARLRNGGDYGLSVDSRDIPEGLAVAGTELTFWGVPSDPSHDDERACPGDASPWAGGPTCASEAPRRAFLRMPTSCAADEGSGVADGLVTSLHTDSWTDPGSFAADGAPAAGDGRWQTASAVSHAPPGFPYLPEAWGARLLPTACNEVPFEPSFTAAPLPPARAGSPSGFVFDLSLPQSEDPEAIGEGDLRKAVVTLPAGVRVSPPSADGLGGCTPGEVGLHSGVDASCPEASKIGAVVVHTPLLEQPLVGSVYLASPRENPFGSLLALYLVVKGPGVVVKLPGRIDADPVTGQLTATFDDTPQLPFSDLRLELKGGPRAPLVTPQTCGTYATHAVLTSWSGKTVASDSSFAVSQAADGGPCTGLGFSPGFVAGSVNPVGGAFSPLSLQLTRSDSDGELGALSSVQLPQGLLADVASVPVRCTDAQAAAAACPAGSHIGEVTVGAGAGSSPFYVGGDVYLTGPYGGAPFGLAVIVHALAGPFDLGYVVVRAAVQVNNDGTVTTRTDPFPTVLQGIPLQVRDIRLLLDRPHFMLNPTSCAQKTITATASSTDGRTAALSSRYQLAGCAALAFHPVFSASTVARTSRAAGASLDVKVISGAGQANIHRVVVSLPRQLPSWLPTLQKACLDSVFDRDPAACPAGSIIGSAVAHTPILASALSGPAYLVSHGGAAFPDLVVVLQGEGITLDLDGQTNIKGKITTSTFAAVPDAPISTFELKLPEGPNHVLAAVLPAKAKHSLCGQKLTMPTSITGQNGLQLTQTTKIEITGCTTKKKHKAGKKHKYAKKG